MEILDKNLEDLLKNILDNKITDVTEEACNKTKIDALIADGFFEKTDFTTLSGWQYIINPTHKANNYFQNKEEFIRMQKSEKKKRLIQISIPIIISFCSLIVSIIALFK